MDVRKHYYTRVKAMVISHLALDLGPQNHHYSAFQYGTRLSIFNTLVPYFINFIIGSS